MVERKVGMEMVMRKRMQRLHNPSFAASRMYVTAVHSGARSRRLERRQALEERQPKSQIGYKQRRSRAVAAVEE